MSNRAGGWLQRALCVTALMLSTIALGCGDVSRVFVDTTADSSSPQNDANVRADTSADTSPATDTRGPDLAPGDARDAAAEVWRDAPDVAIDAPADIRLDRAQDVPYLDVGVGDGPDANAPPTIIDTIPANSATAVAVTTTITIEFSKAMNAATVNVGIQPMVALGSATWNAGYTSIAFAPAASLAAMTRYDVTVTGSDTAGRPLTGPTAFSFTTGAGADTTPPAIRATLPANNATDVPTSTGITITFTEPMDVGSVMVTSMPDIMLGMPTFSAQNDQVSFTPIAPLQQYVEYNITVAGTDPAKNPLSGPTTFKFTTARPPDTTPPTVVSVAPANGSTAVPSNSSIVVTFSEPMNVALTTTAMQLIPPVTCTGGWAWNQTGTTTTCVPSAPLAYSTLYTLNIAASASDVAGNTLGAAYSSSFTTGVMPDTTPPTIVSVIPANGAIGASRAAAITVNFSEAMDIVSSQNAFSITSPAGVTGTFSWANGNTRMTFFPGVQFVTGSVVYWQVTTAARDAAGNAKATLDSFSFNVINSTTINLPCIALLDGYVWSSPAAQTGAAYVAIGDTTSGWTYRGFWGFDMTAIPTSATITAATLYLRQYQVVGTPYGPTRLGDALWRHVDFGPTLEIADYSVAQLPHVSSGGTISTNATYEWKSAVVTTSLRDDLTNRAARGNRSEFMIRMTLDTLTPPTTTNDFAYFYSCEATIATDRPYVSVTYDYP
jgi:hypothetical protein